MASPFSHDREQNPRDERVTALQSDVEGALEVALRAASEPAERLDKTLLEEIESLKRVVRKYGDGPLVLDPVAIELVAAIIDVNYRGLGKPLDFWRSLASKVAESLMESPRARVRLENLWRRLNEVYGAHPGTAH